MKSKRGITLVALVITIIVLLILAGVSISMISGDDGIAQRAADAKEKTKVGDDIEKIKLAYSDFSIEQYMDTGVELEEFLEAKDWCANVTYYEDSDDAIIEMDDGTKYLVDSNKEVIPYLGVRLNRKTLELNMNDDGSGTSDTLIAELMDMTGTINWSIIEGSDKIELSATQGESIIVTSKAAGTAKIKAECNGYSDECTVTIKLAIPFGSYVYYNKTYNDVRHNEFAYTAYNGWRYIGKDTEYYYLLSTGIPLNLTYYSYQPQDWWDVAQDADGNTVYPNVRMTNALKNNFENVVFDGNILGSSFKVGDKAKVKTLTSSQEFTYTKTMIPNDYSTEKYLGVYYLSHLDLYEYGTDWGYYTDSPITNFSDAVWQFGTYKDSDVFGGTNGIRVVIQLPVNDGENIEFDSVNNCYKINY